MKKHSITSIDLTISAFFMAMTIIFSAFGIPVPGGNLYLCDVIICLAALILDPPLAFLVGGLGSLMGDLIFYPVTMLISLLVHGAQGFLISLITHRTLKRHPVRASGIAVAVGTVVMTTGYTIGKAILFHSWEFALVNIPYDLLQSAVGSVLAMLLYWKCGIGHLYRRMRNRKTGVFR